LDVILISNGVLHPQEHRETVIDLWGPATTAMIVCQGINSVLGDSIVIWRAWILWNRRLSVVIAPLALLFGVAFSSFGMAVAHSQVSADPSYLSAFKKFMIAVPSLTLATNITATALILWRVCALHSSVQKVKQHGVTVSHGSGRQLRHLLEILIESGGLYCLTWLLLLCFILTGSPASHVFLSILSQLTGIYPTLIIVLVSINSAEDHNQGPLYESGIRFDRNPQSSFVRTINFTLHGSDDRYERDAEAGDVLKSGGDAGCAIDGTPSTDCPSNSTLEIEA